jgi:hypothetical protein
VGTLTAAANVEDSAGVGPITRWAYRSGYKELRSLTATPNTLVRLHQAADGDLALIALNYNPEPAHIHFTLSTDSEDSLGSQILVGPLDGALFWIGASSQS